MLLGFGRSSLFRRVTQLHEELTEYEIYCSRVDEPLFLKREIAQSDRLMQETRAFLQWLCNCEYGWEHRSLNYLKLSEYTCGKISVDSILYFQNSTNNQQNRTTVHSSADTN